MKKLAIITSHPIQYYAPWFAYLAQNAPFTVRVFYLWDFGVTQQQDAGFQQAVQWDIPLLDGYDSEFVPNVSRSPGTSHFWGLQNPSLSHRVSQYQPDAVLLMNYSYASIYQFLLNWRRFPLGSRKTPLLFRGDSHRLVMQQGLKETLRRQWISLIYQQFSACLYVGKANYRYFQYHGVPEERLFFAPHAIDNDRFFAQAAVATQEAIQWKQELGIPPEHRVILFAGKLIPKKRPLDLLQAFLAANLPQTSLLFVGSGEQESMLRSQAATHPHVYFAPFQNQSQMPRTYAIADVMVLPSHGSGETWGLAVNEAMCLSKPVIVSTHVGCASDLVQSQRNGLIFPAGDVAALRDCLQQALSDREQLRQWGQESANIIRHYGYQQTTEGLVRALDAV
jgi:glycosyltransferase involved in cell wall biosynthesis